MTITPGSPRVLVVDDEAPCAELLVELFSLEGFDVQVAPDGETALASIERGAPDIVLLDIGLPGVDGIEVCRTIKQNPLTRLTPVVLVTGFRGRELRLAGIDAGADDFVSKPFDADELKARVKALTRLKRHTDDLESAESIIVSLALTVEARCTYTEGHCERLANYAVALGKALGLPGEELAALSRGGYLHDVGKIGVPDAVLLKPGRLTPAEFSLIKEHPVIGERLLGNLRSLAPVRPIVRHHHERLDGSGYPDGLRADEIPLLAQIVATVDVFDALTTNRPYRRALGFDDAVKELRADVQSGLLGGRLVEALADTVKIEQHMELSDRRLRANAFRRISGGLSRA
jgi:putative two-component system response regulator